MLKIILILIALLGMISFGLIVATSTGSKDEHEAYERWKERKKHE